MTSKTLHLPVPASGNSLSFYLKEIRKYPMLESAEEYMLAKAWREHGDVKAAHKLVTSHLRLVAKIAMGYRGYGLPLSELVSEGGIGLMQAVKKFDPEKGFRLATYAMWWIKAAIKDYILRSWSLVKMGTTAAQKKLFFNLKRMRQEMEAIEQGDLTPEQVQKIAETLAVSEDDVISMNQRLSGGDQSLNVPMQCDGDRNGQWQDLLADQRETHDRLLEEDDEKKRRKGLLVQAMKGLKDRERLILISRRLNDPPETLETLSQRFGVSRERVRQIEARAYEKLESSMRAEAKPKGLLTES